MGLFRRILLLTLLATPLLAEGGSNRFDLVGPKIDVRVTRKGVTLPIAEVPNLQPGDRLWLHPDLPEDQSARYLLICAFLRGSTNPPPDGWFTSIQTWDKKVREEGAFVVVPKGAEQAVLFMAPETGGDFSTLRKAVEGRPGIFVRASQDLTEAGFEQARIEKYLGLIRRVPPSDADELLKRSNLLARTLALKPNPECFKQPIDMQFTCLTQTGSQTLLDDSHAESIVSALSNGPNSDFINQASYTSLAAGGLYSAYVGAIVDLVRIMGGLHTAQYQYIPAIAFPQAEALNLRLNSPPSFRNPKSVIVIGLPAVQGAAPPPLRPANANTIACMLTPTVTLPIEGAPLVFSTAFAHDLVLHFNVPDGAPAEPDIPLTADAFQGGLVLEPGVQHHVELPRPKADIALSRKFAQRRPEKEAPKPPAKPLPKPIIISGTIEGEWGFDSFTGPTVKLQQLPGGEWHVVPKPSANQSDSVAPLIAGHAETLEISSTGSSCVHTITAKPTGSSTELDIHFKSDPHPGHSNYLTLTLPLEHDVQPGDLHLAIQQFGQPRADVLSARTFSEPAHVTSIDLHAGDSSIVLHGSSLGEIDSLQLGDLNFKPSSNQPQHDTLRLDLPAGSPAPPTRPNDHLTASINLRDGRILTAPVTVTVPRPSLSLLSKTVTPDPTQVITLPDANDVPLSQHLTFTLKTATHFPRDGQIEIETLDGALRTVLTLANSGGLQLQDPRTIVAQLDPLRSFGSSAFGPLQLRAVYPATNNGKGPAETTYSDWLPFVTLVRLPQLTLLTCPTDITQDCTLTGSNLFLVQSLSNDPTFANPVAVPDGFTGTTLQLPHTASGIIYLHLRDDPTPIDPASVPVPTPAPVHTRGSHAGKSSHASANKTD